MNNTLKAKTNKRKANINIKNTNYSNKLIREVKESLADYKKGKYVKGSVSDVMKAIRDYENKTDRN